MTERFACSIAIESEYDSASDAKIIAESLARELDQIEGERARASLDRMAEAIHLEIQAADESALRAGATTWFGLLDVAESAAAIAARDRD
ncbi:MAG: KEOPS complex subunit Pcc1 [Natrialbaceae archaeon]|nr:KEOPS complex subunit Pcc1 [Natrialbaceae archaeon]